MMVLLILNSLSTDLYSYLFSLLSSLFIYNFITYFYLYSLSNCNISIIIIYYLS